MGKVMQIKMGDWLEIGLALLAWLILTAFAFAIWLVQKSARLIKPKPVE
jgi:hypothetical protein